MPIVSKYIQSLIHMIFYQLNVEFWWSTFDRRSQVYGSDRNQFTEILKVEVCKTNEYDFVQVMTILWTL